MFYVIFVVHRDFDYRAARLTCPIVCTTTNEEVYILNQPPRLP